MGSERSVYFRSEWRREKKGKEGKGERGVVFPWRKIEKEKKDFL